MNKQREKAIPTVQLDNHQVIVTRWDFPAGTETGWHTHDHDYVVVPITNGHIRLETPEGERQATLEAGVSYTSHVGVKHNVINDGSEPFSFVEVELKAD